MVNRNQVPLEHKQMLLGVTNDTMQTFSEHCTHSFKSLTGTTWGQQKETLAMKYKAIGRPEGEHTVFNLGQNRKPTSWKKMKP
jgi:hypothetical protein